MKDKTRPDTCAHLLPSTATLAHVDVCVTLLHSQRVLKTAHAASACRRICFDLDTRYVVSFVSTVPQVLDHSVDSFDTEGMVFHQRILDRLAVQLRPQNESRVRHM